MHLNEKDFTSTKPSKSPYFDTKHYTFTIDNVVQWAKVNNKIVEISLEDFLYFLSSDDRKIPDKLCNVFGYYLKQGMESLVFKNKEENKVFKILFYDGVDKDPWEIAKDKIVRHNRVFPETAYRLSHVLYVPWKTEREKILAQGPNKLYYRLKNTEYYCKLPAKDYWPILCQDILDRTNIKKNILDSETIETPIDKYLKSKGFKQLNRHPEPGFRVYKKGRTFINDIYSDNIGQDKDGNYRVFDAIISTDPKKFEGLFK
jgi:hypothetical protein